MKKYSIRHLPSIKSKIKSWKTTSGAKQFQATPAASSVIVQTLRNAAKFLVKAGKPQTPLAFDLHRITAQEIHKVN